MKMVATSFAGTYRLLIFTRLVILVFLPGITNAQAVADSVVPEVDLPQLLFKKKNVSPKIEADFNKLHFAVLPVVGYNPANGFVVGGALSAAKNLGKDNKTRQSSGLVNVTATTKDQVIMIARAGIAFPNNDFLVDVDTRFLVFTQDTYGLGMNTGEEGEADYAAPQPMKFNYMRFYANGFKRLKGNLYGGVGVGFDLHNKIRDLKLAPDSVPPVITDHYTYNTANGFPLDKYFSNGFFFSLRWDSRDNIANPYKGWYANISTRFNSTILGSSRAATELAWEGRYYLGLDKKRPSHLLAFWIRGVFSTEGKLPYLDLPSIGWDTYNRTGRGYIQGRFRGPSIFYFESEYRFPISRNGLLGGVAFTNVTSASGGGMKLMERFAPAAGIGLRVKLDKASRANITVDYAVGANRSRGLFFSLQEAF